jgi:hypothetical protein
MIFGLRPRNSHHEQKQRGHDEERRQKILPTDSRDCGAQGTLIELIVCANILFGLFFGFFFSDFFFRIFFFDFLDLLIVFCIHFLS